MNKVWDEETQAIFDQMERGRKERDRDRPKHPSRFQRLLCTVFGHRPFDASAKPKPFCYTSTGLEDGRQEQHQATQQSVYVYCTRCGDVLKSGLHFDGFVIPGRSTIP